MDASLLEWVNAFLRNCTRSVSVSGVASSSRKISSGVAQGSVLGPILIHVNNLMEGISYQWIAFAEDFKLCTMYIP